MRRLILDRYLLREWLRILVVTALGFPLVVITFGLTDNLDEHLARKMPPKAIAMGYAACESAKSSSVSRICVCAAS